MPLREEGILIFGGGNVVHNCMALGLETARTGAVRLGDLVATSAVVRCESLTSGWPTIHPESRVFVANGTGLTAIFGNFDVVQ